MTYWWLEHTSSLWERWGYLETIGHNDHDRTHYFFLLHSPPRALRAAANASMPPHLTVLSQLIPMRQVRFCRRD